MFNVGLTTLCDKEDYSFTNSHQRVPDMKGILWHGLRNYRESYIGSWKIEFVYWAGMLEQIVRKGSRKLQDIELRLVGLGADIRD